MSFPAYPIYKHSGDEWLSEVPEHWGVLPLKHFAEVDNSGCYGVEPVDGVHIRPVATTAQIDSEGRFDVERMSDRGFSVQELARYQCSPGDVLVVKSSGSAENIISGKAGLVRNDTPPFVFSNFLMRLRHRKDVCLPSFLYSLLISHLTRERIKQMCSTTTYPNLQVGLYTSAKLPCPPLNEQTQIARFLDHETDRIDALIEEQQRLIELLTEKRQALISHAVTKGLDPTVPMKDSGVEWLGEVPTHWDVRKLKSLVSVRGGSTPSKEVERYWVGDIPWVSPKDMKSERIRDSIDHVSDLAIQEGGLSIVKSGAVLIVVRGMILIHSVPVAITDADVTINQDMKAMTPSEKMSCDYLLLLLQGVRDAVFQYIDSSAHGTRKLEWERFELFELPIPPRHEQVEIASFIEKQKQALDHLAEQAASAISFMKERRFALISAAVTGKIDVRGWQPPASTQAPELAVAEAN